ncbi:hypothetical protein [Endozoicomonas sp.]|uniref:hypothetical protein n=1 Tax=Endozoicomonas sp. TaxID=1892382 RepID=UPI003AF5306D
MTTTLDIIDTAVKIGLGAAITGLSTYLLSITNHTSSLEKEALEKHQQLAKEIAIGFEKVETLFNECAMNFHNNDIKSAKVFISQAASEAHSVRAMTNLVGSDELVDELEKCTEILESIYQELLMKRPESPKIDLLGTKMTAIKKSAYPLIRTIYNNRT